MYNTFCEIIKTGDLSQVQSTYQEFKNNNEDIEEILLPKLNEIASMDEIKLTPYGYAVHHNYVDICDFLFKNFPNVEHNMNNCELYDMIDEVCELGHLEMLKWLHMNCKILFAGDYHIDSFISAVTYHHFEVADYLCIMFQMDIILKETLHSLIEKMLKNPDKDILFYLFNKFKQDNKTTADIVLLLTNCIYVNDSQRGKIIKNLCRFA